MCVLGTSHPSCVPTSSWPATPYWPPCMQPWESTPIARASTSCQRVHSWPQPLLLPCPPPLHVCLQPAPAIYRHLPLVPTAKCGHLTGSSHPCCLLSSLAEGSEGTAEDPKSPCSHCGPPCSTHQGPATTQVSMLWVPAVWAEKTTPPPCPSHHKPLHLAPHTARPRVTACSSIPPPTSETVLLLKSVHEVWKKCLFLQRLRHPCNFIYFHFIYYRPPKIMFYSRFGGQ